MAGIFQKLVEKWHLKMSIGMSMALQQLTPCLGLQQPSPANSSSVLMRTLEGSEWWFDHLGSCHPHGRTGRCSGLLALACHSQLLWVFRELNSRWNSFLPIFLHSAFQISKNKSIHLCLNIKDKFSWVENFLKFRVFFFFSKYRSDYMLCS